MGTKRKATEEVEEHEHSTRRRSTRRTEIQEEEEEEAQQEEEEDEDDDEEDRKKRKKGKPTPKSKDKGKGKETATHLQQDALSEGEDESNPLDASGAESVGVYTMLDPKLRRETRAKYRELEADLDQNKEKYIDPLSEALHRKLDEGNALYKNVNTTLEAVRDSRFLATTANYAAIQAQRLKSTFVTFDPNVMMNKVVGVLTGNRRESHEVRAEDFDWKELGKLVAKHSPRVPGVDFLLGPLDIEHRVIKRTQSSKISKNPSELKTSKKLTEQDIKENENETPKNVMAVAECLAKLKREENFFRFVINPNSFSQTVENIFYVSFLIRDGKAEIKLGDDKQPYISAKSAPNPRPNERGEIPDPVRKQNIVEITIPQWEALKELLKITHTTIPHRQKKGYK